MIIEEAALADLEALVATLVESHLDYAWEAWAVVGEDRRARLAQAFRTDLRLLGLPHGVVSRTGAFESVAVWIPAGAGEQLTDDERRRREQLLSGVFGDRGPALDEVEAIVAAAPCPDADWYLATMGTRPACQRQGYGQAVLAPMLARLDRAGQSARLETSTAANLAFYERCGFEGVARLELPHGAPTTWVMHRAARRQTPLSRRSG